MPTPAAPPTPPTTTVIVVAVPGRVIVPEMVAPEPPVTAVLALAPPAPTIVYVNFVVPAGIEYWVEPTAGVRVTGGLAASAGAAAPMAMTGTVHAMCPAMTRRDGPVRFIRVGSCVLIP
ncbi:hypothetical protein LVQ62_07955 [Allobranchiibius sp. GilTou73]|nr:hypothetical protein LVQ62_07955 [Allobranchiibius sp. GilTou73]